jgi:hypothetical protein
MHMSHELDCRCCDDTTSVAFQVQQMCTVVTGTASRWLRPGVLLRGRQHGAAGADAHRLNADLSAWVLLVRAGAW